MSKLVSTASLVPANLRRYAGLRFPIADARIRAVHMAFTLCNEGLAGPRTPFGSVSRNGLLLNDETHDFIYNTRYGQLAEPYKVGRYPVLERYIDSLINDRMSNAEKVITLCQSLHWILPTRYPKVPVFLYGEDDQDTLLKGGGHCSCRGRLLSAMAQMIGLQGRPVMQWAWIDFDKNPDKLLGGHTVAEILIDGHWGFFDPQHACYCYDGQRVYSVAEIRRNPEVWTRMPDAVTRDMQIVPYKDPLPGMNFFEYYWYKNFNPKCPIQISRHDVNGDYQVKWTWATEKFRELQTADMTRNQKLLLELAQRGELTDEVYQLGLEAFRDRFSLSDRSFASQAPAQPELAGV
jgi:hypothetical protein